ncbi:MAG: NfeD family protein [Chthoniobacterales bacterium]
MWWLEVIVILLLIAIYGLSGESHARGSLPSGVAGPGALFLALYFVNLVIGVARGLRALRLPVKVGLETMLGKTVNALTPIDAKGGKVFIEGEYWNATSDTSVEKGHSVRITAVEGLTVKVEPAP